MIGTGEARTLHVVEPWSGREASRFAVSGQGCDSLLFACSEELRAQGAADGVNGAGGARWSGAICDVCLLGATEAERRARRIGLLPSFRISPPFNRPELAWPALKQAIATRKYTKLVLWGGRVGRLAHAAGSGVRTEVRRLVEGGVAPKDLHDKGDSCGAEAVRDWWRTAHAISEEELVVALLDEPAHRADARRFLYLLATLEVAARRVVGVLPAGLRGAGRAQRFRRSLALGTRLITADRPIQGLLPACDLGLMLTEVSDEPTPEGTTAGVAALNIQLAVRAGLVVVMPAHPLLAGLNGLASPAEGAPGIRLAKSGHSTDLNRVLFELASNQGWRRRTLGVAEGAGTAGMVGIAGAGGR